MARFLSAEWFVALGLKAAEGRPEAAVALEIVVTGTPQAEVRYQVVVQGSSAEARWRQEDFLAPDVRFSCDYATISAIAQGRLLAVEALAQGMARVAGNTAALSRLPPLLDLVPPALRATTTF